MDIDFARPCFGDEERRAVDKVMQGVWLASGEQNRLFEREFAEFVGSPYALAVNSGSSANLIALAALDLPKGSKVLTSGCGFPATLSPILHLGLEPVLIDYDRDTCNIDLEQLHREVLKGQISAIILAHTMGNPVDMRLVTWYLDYWGIPVIEDCCESIFASLPSTPDTSGRVQKQVGTWGDMGTFSFYPSHQITALGGGGMVTFKTEAHYLRAKSLRDWGKTQMPGGYGRNKTSYNGTVDEVSYFPHYIYDTVGWNMKLPEANCAFGREQLKRLPHIVSERNKNHDYIASRLDSRAGTVTVPNGAIPSWFGVLLSPIDGNGHDLGDRLEARGISHRPFFAGNITRHPPFQRYRTQLPVADSLMASTIFVGCYAGLTEEQLDYMATVINEELA